MRSIITSSDMLLQCPCCGCDPAVHDVKGIWDNGVFVECPNCGLRTGEAAYITNENALDVKLDMCREVVFERVAASWNLRAPLPAPPKVWRRYRRPAYVPVYKTRGLLQ